MRAFLLWMEQSALGGFMRESSLWTYPIVNLAHIFGIAALFGAVVIIDLRLLGVWRRVPLTAITDVAIPVAISGFVVAIMTGSGLLATKATEYIGNPYLLIKFAAIAVGVINAAVFSASPAWNARRQRPLSPREDRQLAFFGGISLVCWVVTVSAGRLIAYW
jgi:hypothetical protein